MIGELSYFLGLQIKRLKNGIFISQGKYINDMVKKFGLQDAKWSAGILQIIHTDICGPFPVKSVDGYDSFITFTDDYSRYGYIYPIKERT